MHLALLAGLQPLGTLGEEIFVDPEEVAEVEQQDHAQDQRRGWRTSCYLAISRDDESVQLRSGLVVVLGVRADFLDALAAALSQTAELLVVCAKRSALTPGAVAASALRM
jgi:hypothetical protein